MDAVTVTTENFQSEVLESDQVVLTDFWATWCAPCRMMEPVVESLAEQYDGKLKVGKINVDEEPNLAAQYGIMSIPSFLVFHKGELVGQTVGAVQPQVLEFRTVPEDQECIDQNAQSHRFGHAAEIADYRGIQR